MDVSTFSDPTKLSGLWFKIHIDAAHAVTDELKRSFEININHTCDNFKCKKCQPHFRKFIDTHPFFKYWNIKDEKGRDIGMFQWSWELHNQVNRFLNKPQPGLMEAYEYYVDSEAGACFNCGGANTPNDEYISPPSFLIKKETVKPAPMKKLLSRK